MSCSTRPVMRSLTYGDCILFFNMLREAWLLEYRGNACTRPCRCILIRKTWLENVAWFGIILKLNNLLAILTLFFLLGKRSCQLTVFKLKWFSVTFHQEAVCNNSNISRNLFYKVMSTFHSAGQWKQCCNDLLKIEVPSPRKSHLVTAKQGSLYHEMGNYSITHTTIT